MKAKVINSKSEYYGRVVNVRKMEDTQFFANRYEMIYGKGVFFGDELEFNIEKEHNINSENDWSAFRREAAKNILCALVGNKDYLKVIGRIEPETMLAIRFADELCKQLKEEKQ